ncbi:MAG TPA: ATP-binding cassette domain-containing protein [Chitinophagaceae bacterium]|nr:ATP-binding cassette domain-containing protein [Chitinophagaceae bacterium]
MDDLILEVENVSVSLSGVNILDRVSFSLKKKDCLAITGPSGSGKTMLGLILAKKIFFRGSVSYGAEFNDKIVWVGQQHHFKNLQHTSDMYYQQRFNSYDTDETETVAESLGEDLHKAKALFQELGIDYLMDRRLIQLSNGENKKLQLLKARINDPKVIILDQPFIGLDIDTREWLKRQFEALKDAGVLLILITSSDEIPAWVSKIIFLEKGKPVLFETFQSFKNSNVKINENSKAKFSKDDFFKFFSEKDDILNYETIIEMYNVSVQYGDKIILENINWKVMNGQRWLLSGPNGAGKSTLLSLITADNPKAYANSIYLFGKKRGSGESIWDIKKKIGFISPELHLYFNRASTGFETVASGLFDTIGLFRPLSDEDTELVKKCMSFCRVKEFQQKRLQELSLGEQRSILLARALIKNPPLLILDEPCQGLDSERKDEFLELINEVCIAGNKTMVFVSHYENERPACISHFLKLEKGKVSEMR